MTFNQYCQIPEQDEKSGHLEIIKRDDGFIIFIDDHPLLTRKKGEFYHSNERVLQMVITGIMFPGNSLGSVISAKNLFGFQYDIVGKESVQTLDVLVPVVENDPFVKLKTIGKTGIAPLSPTNSLFNFSFITLASLVRSINELVNKSLQEQILEESDRHPFVDLIWRSIGHLANEQQTVLQALADIHGAGVVLPLGLITGLICPTEYVNGLIALQLQPDHHHASLIHDAVLALDYIASFNSGSNHGKPLQQLIRDGESESLEFKSTLRWDIRAGKTNQAVERACLKTISAFLNTHGGILLIGVRDDGSIEGIESDKFVNEDKFLLHLWTLIRTCLGRDVTPSIQTSLGKMEEKTVCIVRCGKHKRPVFLRQPGFPEEFFIRLGPASNAMDISEALKYIADHFSDQ